MEKKRNVIGEIGLMTVVYFGRQLRFRNAAWVDFGAVMYIVQIGQTL
jgi:hypothetical protein